MKKQLLKSILLVFLFSPVFGQQTLNFIKGLDVGGVKINALEVKASKPTKRWVLMYLGTGELGPADGSQIGDLDNYGYQKTPSFDIDFNIFVPQAVRGYIESDAVIQQYLLNTYGQDIEIFMTGHSLGARNVMEFAYGYQGIKAVPQVVGFMPVAGEMSWPLPVDWCTATDKPVRCFSGDKDEAIWYGQSQKYAAAMNSCPTRVNKVEVRIIAGLNHGSIMNYVFNPDKTSEGYQFIMSCWKPEENPVDVPGKIIRRGTQVIAKFEDGQEVILK